MVVRAYFITLIIWGALLSGGAMVGLAPWPLLPEPVAHFLSRKWCV